jgi:peptide deformylase
MILPILKIPNETLKTPALPVEKFDQELIDLVENMVETMKANDGTGLASNQVGVLKSVIVVEHEEQVYKLVNPVITWQSELTEFDWEGCLSIPNKIAKVRRPVAITIGHMTTNSKINMFDAEGYLARKFLHEIDHINGILMTQRTKYIYALDQNGEIIK